MKKRIILAMSIIILGFCAYGFGRKFIELILLLTSDTEAAQEGIFAVAPLVNYMLASAGFLCLLGWAAAHGMFTDIERPKQTMLDDDIRLDAQTDDIKYCRSVME
ncbi:MAG: hypothetical protein GXP24_04650 [Planctomycetes bacterium]|nr:hypothetical protein [Planctomycetota bacterium]